MIKARFISIMCLICFVKCKMEPFVVGGTFARISHFPHSAYMSVHCFDEDKIERSWICGASIVNQVVTLTAAHCLFGCDQNSSISVSVGHSHRDQGVESTVHSYMIHEDYDEREMANDIALVMLNTVIEFSKTVKRVVLMKTPPYFEKAQIAGWGLTDEAQNKETDLLKYVDQFVMSENRCTKYLEEAPKGTFCARSVRNNDYSTRYQNPQPLRSFILLHLRVCISKNSEKLEVENQLLVSLLVSDSGLGGKIPAVILKRASLGSNPAYDDTQ